MSSIPPPPPPPAGTSTALPPPAGLPALPAAATTTVSTSEHSRSEAVNSIVAAGLFSRPELDAQIRHLIGGPARAAHPQPTDYDELAERLNAGPRRVVQRQPTDYEEVAERLICAIGLIKELDNHRRFLAERVSVLEERMLAVEQTEPSGYAALKSAQSLDDHGMFFDGELAAPLNWPVFCESSEPTDTPGHATAHAAAGQDTHVAG